MHKSIYQDHLQRLSVIQWGTTLLPEALDRIMSLTELHPYYINVLCQQSWESKQKPDTAQIDMIWRHSVENQRYMISQDLLKLSINQRKMIRTISKK